MVSEHEVYEDKWNLVGQRVWDALRALDYACLDPLSNQGVAVVGHSLGGEISAYVGALDTRVKFVDASGALTSTDNLLDVTHCPCWKTEGLISKFSPSDIYCCIAPRHLICELGVDEAGRSSYPIESATEAFREICQAYQAFDAEENITLDVHPGGHVFGGENFSRLLALSMRSKTSQQVAQRPQRQ